ncbi:Aryl hydrocarbon receptor nuclear translocator-like protein 2 [Atta colombica]|uniref:Aryl hydrocarbon receptor nuclear translocator-like protein 2 n=1 Tax=Atta colombica TaxID=520822 RepID=A0A195BDE0_9HYME|nr:Aryl hydrocarbon receptor nuclear translocator-like protein 2 [Atta colombica]
MHLEVYGMWQQQHQQAFLRGLPPQHPQQTLHPGIIGTDNHAPHQQQHHQHHRATIMDLPVPSNPRASRNMAEKQRRDNLNANISTMATLVPSVAGSSRRMDKISILRLATAFLRTRYSDKKSIIYGRMSCALFTALGRGCTNFLPPLFKDQFDLEQFFVDHLVDSGGFFIVLTTKGNIVYVSRQVEQHLGHVQFIEYYREILHACIRNFHSSGLDFARVLDSHSHVEARLNFDTFGKEKNSPETSMLVSNSRLNFTRLQFAARVEASQICDIASHPDSPQFLKISSMFLRENNETDDSGTVNELLGQCLFNFIYPDDLDELKRNLLPDGQPMTSSTPSPMNISQVSELTHDNSSNSSEESSTSSQRSNEKLKRFFEQRRNFKIRIAQRTNSRRDHTQYECFDISGLLRLAEACKNVDIQNGHRGRQREATSTTNDIVFAGIATLPQKRPITELSIMDANKDEYVTRHLVDGRIIYCDHRVSVIAGYLSEEISGLNAFGFMHKDDCRWTMIGLRQMYDRAEMCGTSCYRLLTKNGEFIYLRTHGYLEIDRDMNMVESFVCVNTMVTEEEGIQLIKDMKIRFSATVSASSKSLIPDIGNNALPIDMNTLSSNSKANVEDPSQLEVAINYLISDLPSSVITEDCLSPSPMPHTQYVKAAIFSSRMPPVSAHANKIGINKINRCIVIQGKGKGKASPKQESKHTIGKLINSNSAEQSPMSDSESVMSSGKPLSMFEMINADHNSHGNIQNADMSAQSKVLATRKSGKNSRASRNHTSCLDSSPSANVLNGTACNIKVERGTEEAFNCVKKQEVQYFDDSASDNSIASSGIEMHNRCPLKRICSDENLLVMHSKKRSNDVYTSTNINNEQQHISYLKCRSFASEYPTFSDEFNQYNDVNSQPLTVAESPNSSLHEVGTDYQQLVDPAVPLGVTNHDEEQFVDLQDLKEDTLLSSELDASPELMMKIFGGLRNGTTGFEDFDEAKIQQLTPDDQVVNDELSRTYYQLADSMALHESQINVLARDLKNPALRIQRKNLSQLQVEHNMQKQMLKTLQQDHCKMQVSAKQKLGI